MLQRKKFLFNINQLGFTYVEAIISISLTLVAAGETHFWCWKSCKRHLSITLKKKH